ncbi:MAG: helix-turn-helix domain-containing protein [Candidatus Thiodiazotropha sp. (ex Lucinoma aequizonata)]|nr:helix-turn-helix domain-containing protein [Candidatus Thiodiazotropha sp. (ex Lucinoma aequizonata)]MCU7897561.1 helix-turn-helix domain-containing protein [Candidatus Thiodiazotropha sp. (ex Lucinoma aequizonata)]MCU7907686.1 helix-turn-helix domain-containing protein [Candidatus Thiodiazotropha sp. (ex Lucinoma aequizonata)]
MYRSASTISRELRRNRGLRGYRPAQAQRLSEARRRESHKACKITDEVREWIETLIRQELSSQQVVDYLKRHKRLSLHHETVLDWFMRTRRQAVIYTSIYGLHPRHTASAMVIMIVAERSRSVLILMNVPLLWSLAAVLVTGKGTLSWVRVLRARC